ncbi:CvpA family protein [Pontibacter silvestris]|uniref:CvpA family protein n=1 Tax=Pontibacter silvestris TaxID=2305183 RepID=A0ABW4X3L5_9BACT|nr:CvpA family protein [Pontibacter silvestris]MCC9134796.1 CvpA family protein [Pontibacter silvestris]
MINYIDILIVLIILSSVVSGWYRGFILGLLDLVRWVGSLLIGLKFYPYVADWLTGNTNWSEVWIPPVSFLLVTIVASILVQYLGTLILQKLPQNIHTRKSNQVLGVIPGLFSGLITATIVAVLLLAVPMSGSLETNVQESKLTNKLASYTDRIEMALAPVFDEAAQRTLTKLTVDPESEKFIELPFETESFKPRPDLEAEMLELVNEERVANGLKPLKADTALRRVARLHSADMFRRGYFSHYSPEGEDAFDRMREAEVSFRAAGENLALAPTLPIAHNGLMNSPGHRANILQKRFGRVGIGVIESSGRGLMITQNFRN